MVNATQNSSLDTQADSIINNHVLGATTLGILPIPMIDFIGLSMLQCQMIKGLCELYGHPYSQRQANIWLISITGGYSSTYIGSRLLMSWLKIVPGISLGTSASAGMITYALGVLFHRHFKDGGTPATLNTDVAKRQYKAVLEKEPAKPEVTKPEPTKPEPTKPQATKPQANKQDLTMIEGIGPKTQQLLAQQGINNFKQLADTSVNQLTAILTAAGGRFSLSNPETWPEQAQLADQGDWPALTELKSQLKGGRRQ